MAKTRQTWIRGAERPCPHDVTEEVRSFGGKVLAERCNACLLLIAQHGPCAGCKRERRLVHFVAARREAYCSKDCWQATQKAKREALEAASAAAVKAHLARGSAA